ncbi:MAG TPA: DUF3769 domain-containing protein [Leptolyngbyaceae cyanobacterium]
MPFPLILSEVPVTPSTVHVSLHPAGSAHVVDPSSEENSTASIPATSASLALPVSTDDAIVSQSSLSSRLSASTSSVTPPNPSLLVPLETVGLRPPGASHSFQSPQVTTQTAQVAQESEVVTSTEAWIDRAFPSKTAAASGSEPQPTTDPAQAADPAQATDPAQAAPLIIRADSQSYDQTDQVVSAYGNVRVQFGNAQLSADRLWANLANRYIRAEDNVLFTRNNQIIAGSTATYNLAQGAGTIFDARGELALNEIEEDFSTDRLLADPTDGVIRPIDQQLLEEGSISSVTSPGGLSLGTDARGLAGGESENINRLRFEANRIDFDASGWQAEGLRLTNDPFSPPEIEFRGDTARLTPLNAEEDELVITNARVVFDQGFSIPLLRNRILLRRGQVDPSELSPVPTIIGIDGRDRDGLYVERPFSLYADGSWQLTLAPQFYIQRWLGESGANIGNPANFGIVGNLNGRLGPRTSVRATASLSGLDLGNFSNRLRASVRGQQLIGDHTLNLEYSFRDRLYNGSLGFQDVQSSLGVVLLSPAIRLGDTQIDLSYQVSGQYVTATTDRADLLGPSPLNNFASLLRFQGSVALGRAFLLWEGKGLPPTPTEGLRFSPRPVVPFLQLVTGLRGTTTYYSSNDIQETLTANIGLVGQFGHFSRDFLDYTQFNIGYSKSIVGGATSPFLFDRNVDQNVISGGIIQQIYGPFRAGFQTSLNLDTGRLFDTDLIFEYSRRAYGLVLRYSPSQSTGFLGFRLSDFSWIGRGESFDSNQTSDQP